MNSKLKFLPVNWKNGMSFSEDHLKSEYLAILDAIRDKTALSLTSYNYGLLGAADGQKKFADAFIGNINNEKVEISVCRAVTQNGSRIEILDQQWEELNKSVSELIGDKNIETSNFWYVLLIIDPFVRIPEGEEDVNEITRRKPYTRPAYQMELVSLKDLKLDNLANAIPIAKYEFTASRLKKVEEYIPPCARITSSEALFRKYEEYDNILFLLKDFSEKIIEKVDNKRRKRQSNKLAEDIELLCKRYLEHFALSYDEYKYTLKDAPPLKLVEFFATMARVLNHAMDSANNRSHMLKYFHQYATDLNEAKIAKLVNNTFEVKYDHFDLNQSLTVVDEFLASFYMIFEKLVKLDFEELAPRKMVERDQITNVRETGPNRLLGGRITIKNPGREDKLGDELTD
jgi:hypothetical protein